MIKKLRVTIEGKAYEVDVEVLDTGHPAVVPVSAPAPAPVARTSPPSPATPAAPAASSPTAPAGPGSILSPLAGRVVAVGVQVGQEVKEGDQLLTLEAMKMNTFVNANRSGKVTALHVAVGDAVEEGQAMLQIE
ncbi:MAG: biotin/lipoyl-containing protein [Candidatus Methylacidiphilales bacterium]|nr:biotin/lipoyl-containing protein [Candidatus Methylacidiphilales bacterium]